MGRADELTVLTEDASDDAFDDLTNLVSALEAGKKGLNHFVDDKSLDGEDPDIRKDRLMSRSLVKKMDSLLQETKELKGRLFTYGHRGFSRK